MDTALIYILKSTICLSLFYWGYKFLLSKETFFKFNRMALLIGITASLCLPLVQIEFPEETLISPDIITSIASVENENYYETEMPMGSEYEIIPATSIPLNETVPIALIENKTAEINIPWGTILLSIYCLGICINFVLLIISYIKMMRIIGQGETKYINGYCYLSVNESIVPFSWRDKIVVSKNDSGNIEEIVMHENAHIIHKHYLDILFTEFILLFHWFNPFAWKLKQELKDIHEYQADNKVVNSGISAVKYQLLILEKAVGSSSYTLANSFNHSKIKKRITMMLKQKSKSWNRLKLLFLIPIAMLSVYAFACTGLNSKSESTEKSVENEITVPEDESTGRAFHMPIKEEHLKRMAAGYGMRVNPIYGTKRLHPGMDYTAAEGTIIHAVKEGTVTESHRDSISGYGNIIKIAHKYGVESWYAHNKENLVQVGDKVKLGQEIASVGKTGVATGPHLHWEIRIHGIPTNPSKLYESASESGEGIINADLIDFLTTNNIVAHPIPTYTKEPSRHSQAYGMVIDPIYGTEVMHTGLDFAASKGDTIYAFRNGVVSEASENKWGYGKLVRLKHADNMETYYAHCDALLVTEGNMVKAGQPIALVGNTGKSTQNHLHLEVRIDTVAQDPGKFYNFANRERFDDIKNFKSESTPTTQFSN